MIHRLLAANTKMKSSLGESIPFSRTIPQRYGQEQSANKSDQSPERIAQTGGGGQTRNASLEKLHAIQERRFQTEDGTRRSSMESLPVRKQLDFTIDIKDMIKRRAA